jgi:hypothetical protein
MMQKAIYFPASNILSAEVGNHPSQIWRAIIEGRDVLRQGLIRRVGDGSSIDIWSDNWIPRDENMRPIVCLAAVRPILVSELINHVEASWNREVLQQTFLPVDVDAILSIPLCTRNNEDFWA